MQNLPIDGLLPEVLASLAGSPSVVIEAPPGAGKTTRVPAALLEGGAAGGGEVWVLEPRRLAARLSARRVAEERGERLGETVGYQVRFEEVAGPQTRLRFLTEGVLTRRLLSDPKLERAGVVVLDEFHERHLQADLALALLKRLQSGARPDLKLVAMSATLDAAPLAGYLDNCPVLRSEGRRFEVSVEHLQRPDERPLEAQVAAAVGRLCAEGLEGDVLVFLPGAAAIRRAQTACASLADREGLLVLPLHGELPAEEQDRAVRPADRRKLILSTNVAETSVTIEGVVAVVDSGLARVAGHSPWSGLPALRVGRVSQASAAQRAGRAGRTRPGRCLRLYTAQDFAARPPHETPEVRRLDLAEAVLELRAAGVRDVREFDWYEAPAAESLSAAEGLLGRLGALGERGELTPTGRKMLRLPLHPRLARVVSEGEARGVGPEACVVAALIAERDIRGGEMFSAAGAAGERRGREVSKRHGSSDVLELYDLFREAERARFAPSSLRAAGLNTNAVRHVERARRQLQGLIRGGKGEGGNPQRRVDGPPPAETEEALLVSILAGYPDRVARRRDLKDEGAELLLSGGGSARLAPESVVRGAEFLVAVEAEERRGAGPLPAAARGAQALVRLASAVEPDWLLDLFADALREKTEARWNAQAERAEVWSRLVYDQLLIDEWRARGAGAEGEAARVLAEAAHAAGPSAFVEREALERFLARVEFVARTFPSANFPAVGEAEAREALAAMCEGRRSFAELREAARAGELFERLRALLSPEQSRLLAQMAPERVTLAGGRAARVSYEAGREPFIASRLQDFFGMREGPRVAGGRVALVLHLLAPNRRPVQLTTDLAGFWARHYPQVRRELSRRYPRHPWPEDPLRNNPRE